ncbi:MAG TPA: helix-turn-helix domain-containing protein [Bryobacteraceae bacterium]|nr:helix-turn-helix domain-containing protein [Bryobacteraceae bacterium]
MRENKLPDITHLQFLVLGVLLNGEQPGRTVREAIARFGVRRNGPAFYQMMARLERDGLVEGWYEQIPVGGQKVTERRYRIRPAGSKVWTQTRSFYERVSLAAVRQEWSNA